MVVYFARQFVRRPLAGGRTSRGGSDDVGNYWLELLGAQAEQACAENRLQVTRLQQNRIAMSVPVERPDAPKEALSAVFLLGSERPESFVVILQLMAGLLTAYHLQRQNQGGEWEMDAACAILDLVMSVGKASDVRDAGVLLVNAVKNHLGCSRVAIGLKKRRGTQCNLLAISGMSDLNLQAEMPLAVQGTLVEAVRGGEWTVWPADAGPAGSLLPAHARLAAVSGEERVCSAPLRGADGKIVGAWAFWGFESADTRFAPSGLPGWPPARSAARSCCSSRGNSIPAEIDPQVASLGAQDLLDLDRGEFPALHLVLAL